MNLENLRENYGKLISHMETEGKHGTYIKMFQKTIDAILSNAAEQEWADYESFYRYFVSYVPASTHRQYKTVVAAIRAFDLYGEYPDGKHRELVDPDPLLCDEFSALLEYYTSHETKAGRLKPVTIERNASSGKMFLFTLQSAGITALSAITEEAILSLFTADDGKLTKGITYFYAVKRMFSVCAGKFPIGSITAMIPAVCKHRKNVQYLTAEETEKIRAALMDTESPLSFLDRAIVTIAYYTGMRRSDIAGLRLDSFDLDNDRIRIFQQKTGEPLELPLRAVVGNAVYDYVTLERPKSQETALFLNRYRKPISPQSLGGVSERVMKAAGIRQKQGYQRKGLHIFRFHLAAKLLESETPQPVISSTLGHADPASVETYLSADFVHLRECSLSVDKFPVAKGVLK